MRNIHPYPDIQVYTTADSKPISNDFKNADNLLMDSHRSNHTFTPPTTSLSPHSSSNDLHVTSSSFSVDLPQLKYAIEKFLLDDDDPVYQFVDEFPSGSFFSHQGKLTHRSLFSSFNHFSTYFRISSPTKRAN